ncbi:pyridoxal-phosphate dependent enzyme-domain-containing protein [Microdochium trichocladiopsis]|uniref:Pyridoxal-phosphate dependent enzyme-domain-containing protein n=1 Tax=Microdochium trichocladiopsis TaxID=1682393 RepID=A0A9P9BQ26_9PEZI|nr:pyridoxal-phosphate dependent enzyme-domain-containing protein [Microdochium trichocladiopsis]KAH7029889.1 pyridoxal-phosphate dependent enzyme-domain-containing protein [Microdochium trichocladiopsis]
MPDSTPFADIALRPESVRQARKIAEHIYRTDLRVSEWMNRFASSDQPETYRAVATTKPEPRDAKNTGGDILRQDQERDAPPRVNLYFKCENLQRTGAFKARGAFHALSRLMDALGADQMRHRGVTTVSSGNHAQGLALAAATFGVPAVIVMPRTSTPSKIQGGPKGEIVLCGASNDDKQTAAAEIIKGRGCIFVPPYAHPDIITGQGTCALELEQQFMELNPGSDAGLDMVIAPIGGGGLLGGTATWFSDKPNTKVFGAEPSFQGADDARRGLRRGSRVKSVASSTIADGLRTPVGPINWKIVSDPSKVEDVLAVDEDEIKLAMRLMYQGTGMLVEPSGCVPLAVVLFNADFRRLLARQQKHEGSRALNVAIVLSGGNTTMETLDALTSGWNLPGCGGSSSSGRSPVE